MPHDQCMYNGIVLKVNQVVLMVDRVCTYTQAFIMQSIKSVADKKILNHNDISKINNNTQAKTNLVSIIIML